MEKQVEPFLEILLNGVDYVVDNPNEENEPDEPEVLLYEGVDVKTCKICGVEIPVEDLAKFFLIMRFYWYWSYMYHYTEDENSEDYQPGNSPLVWLFKDMP